MSSSPSKLRHAFLPGALLISIATSWWLSSSGDHVAAHTLRLWSLAFGSLPLFYNILASFSRKSLGIDIIALLAVIAALLLGEYTVGLVILFMLSTGEALENFAILRARKEITALLEQAPDTAQKKVGESLKEVSVETLIPGDTVVVRPGEVVPVDGIVLSGFSTVNEAALTGESLPQTKTVGAHVMSGSVNQAAILEIKATATSHDSKYEQIIRLVREAEANEAPFVRLADQYSARFTLITLAFALLAWILSHDPIRVLAVLVVATPCPLILATPIAFASGISRAAKRGIIVKNGGALEALARARSFVFDKTGTLTLGTPAVTLVESHSLSKDEVLRIAASLEQLSTHILAESLSHFAKTQKLTLEYPTGFHEIIGQGVSGSINGITYHFGSINFLETQGVVAPQETILKHQASRNLGHIVSYLANEHEILGDIHFADTVREETKSVFAHLREQGIKHIVMLTGDKKAVAQRIADEAGITRYRAECLPEDKIQEVKKLQEHSGPTVMIGDGVNDAPALVTADIGIALGSRGATASSEAADIVITVNRLDRVGEAFELGKLVLLVAKQGILLGIGLSIFLMILASFGLVPPVLGAILQECIDVLAIGNALRVHARNLQQ